MSIDIQDIRKISKDLNDIRRLLQHSIAIQLYCAGATQDEIAKNLKIGKNTVNAMVKGVKKEKGKKTRDES